MAETITINPTEALSQKYKIRRAHRGKTLEVCVPAVAIEREARKHALTVDEFLDQFRAEFYYDGFSGLLISFVRIVEQ